MVQPTYRLAVLLLAGGLALAGCSTAGSTETPATPTTLTVLTHDSFDLSDEAKARFASQTGLTVTYLAPGDAGSLVNQLVLTKDAPLGDVVFGIDNTFAGRAIAAGILAPYDSPAKVAGDFGQTDSLTAIDYGDVCLNADPAWFTAHQLPLPQTLDDLVKPEYAGLTVISNPASSSPGLAFLIATVAAYGETGYLDYWAQLRAGGLKVVAGWTEAYNVEFSGSSGQGAYPVVLSYATSPLYEPATQNLPQTCFRQVEYAGVIAGAKNPAGAQAFIDFLLSADTQAEFPTMMYMSPVNPAAAVPADWAAYAEAVTNPYTLPAATITAQRDGWLEAWTDTVLG